MRASFGALVLVRTTGLLDLLGARPHVSPPLGWPAPGWHVAAFRLALPSGLVMSLCVARTLAAVAFTLGAKTRTTGTLAATCGWIVLAQDALGYINTLHLLYLGML